MMKNSMYGQNTVSVPVTTLEKCSIPPVGLDSVTSGTRNPHPVAPPITVTADSVTVGNIDARPVENGYGTANIHFRSIEPEHCLRPVPAGRFNFADNPDEIRKAYPYQERESVEPYPLSDIFCDSAMFF
jgi:hypothetical protein